MTLLITLCAGAPYMIMHNVNATLFNGTRVTYHRRVGKCLEVEVASGIQKGELHYLPRLVLTARSVKLPFTLHRTQFPMVPCFAMTVHKSQGQTLDKVGILFSHATWAHGLLYVAVSRVRKGQDCFWMGSKGTVVSNYTNTKVLL
jgi:ATP-dependent exoDNAse (exonuclease V) alpha subunit